MVTGLYLFIEHFQPYTDHYILIGGGACDWQMEQKGLPFRATKDLDIILIIEALSDEFVNHFWQFIKDGEYVIAEVGEKKSFYRFIKPNVAGYPYMLELFSRKPDLIKEIPGMHLTNIPTGEEASSLSAILLDDEYYSFTLANTQLTDGLHLANEIALICLKARAFLNNARRKAEGHEVQQDDITKHRNDVIRLTATLTPGTIVPVPNIVKADLLQYIEIIRTENPNIKQLLKNQGMANITINQIIEQLIITFNLSL
ncbi:MAG: hypothetical protein FD178_3168 [Ignavibacteria bacterium]|nr:MAG: hypothetical protein FD178_3168 [Ignavibacteria bacterium]